MKTIMASATGWQVDDRPLWARVRRWAFSMAERELSNGRLADDGAVFPMSLLNSRVVFTKDTIAVKTPWWGILVIKHTGRKVEQVFLTMECAYQGVFHIHTWLYGAPPEVTKFVENRAVA